MSSQSLLRLNLHISSKHRANEPILLFSGMKTLPFSDNHLMVSTQPFQFLRPKSLESFSVLFPSQTSSSYVHPILGSCFSNDHFLPRPLLKPAPVLPTASSLMSPALILDPYPFSTWHRVIPIKLKLDHVIPLFGNL